MIRRCARGDARDSEMRVGSDRRSSHSQRTRGTRNDDVISKHLMDGFACPVMSLRCVSLHVTVLPPNRVPPIPRAPASRKSPRRSRHQKRSRRLFARFVRLRRNLRPVLRRPQFLSIKHPYSLQPESLAVVHQGRRAEPLTDPVVHHARFARQVQKLPPPRLRRAFRAGERVPGSSQRKTRHLCRKLVVKNSPHRPRHERGDQVRHGNVCCVERASVRVVSVLCLESFFGFCGFVTPTTLYQPSIPCLAAPPSRRLGPAPSAPLLRPRRPPRAGRVGSTYTSLSSTPGANRVAPRVKSGSRKSAARLRTMATFGFCGLCCRGRGVGASRVSGSRTGDVDRELEHREPCSDTPDVRELGESSRPPPVSPEEKIRLLARSYARSFNKDGVFSLPVLLPRLRPPSPALGGRTETSGTAPVDATPSPPSSLRNTTRAGGAALAPPMRGEFLALKRAPSSFTLA